MPSEITLEPPTDAQMGKGGAEMGIPSFRISPLRYLLVVCLMIGTAFLIHLAGASVKGHITGVGLKSLAKEVGPEKFVNDGTLSDLEIEQLAPEDYLWRTYTKTYSYRGELYEVPLDFMVIYGYLKQTFHEPGQCLPGGGWQINTKSTLSPARDEVPVPMGQFIIRNMDKEGREIKQVVLYAFVHKDRATPSLFWHNVNLLNARIRHDKPTGAFVRVTVPIVTTEEDAISRGKTFINTIYPELRERID